MRFIGVACPFSTAGAISDNLRASICFSNGIGPEKSPAFLGSGGLRIERLFLLIHKLSDAFRGLGGGNAAHIYGGSL